MIKKKIRIVNNPNLKYLVTAELNKLQIVLYEKDGKTGINKPMIMRDYILVENPLISNKNEIKYDTFDNNFPDILYDIYLEYLDLKAIEKYLESTLKGSDTVEFKEEEGKVNSN